MIEFIQVFTTVISGVLIFVSGQIIIRFFIDPGMDQRKLIGEIADSIIYYAYLICNPTDCKGLSKDELTKYQEAKEDLRQKSSMLRSRTHLIPAYDYLSKIRLVIPKKDINIASRNLIAISNNLITNVPGAAMKNYEWRNEIINVLKLPKNI